MTDPSIASSLVYTMMQTRPNVEQITRLNARIGKITTLEAHLESASKLNTNILTQLLNGRLNSKCKNRVDRNYVACCKGIILELANEVCFDRSYDDTNEM